MNVEGAKLALAVLRLRFTWPYTCATFIERVITDEIMAAAEISGCKENASPFKCFLLRCF